MFFIKSIWKRVLRGLIKGDVREGEGENAIKIIGKA